MQIQHKSYAMTLRFDYPSHTSYFAKRVVSVAKLTNTPITLSQKPPHIYVNVEKNIEAFTKSLDEELYNSLFFKKVEIEESEVEQNIIDIPSSVGLCPRCIQEMLDSNSRRFYYPFTMCSSCGYQSAFVQKYPFKRENTLLNFFQPCDDCQKELQANPFRVDFPLISCTQCSIPIKLEFKNKTLFANSKEEFKRAFEMAASAILDGKKVAMKTFRGWRRFFLQKSENVLLVRPSEDFLLLGLEKRALFSIERPMMYATSSSGEIVNIVAVWDGFTLLLANELKKDYIYFDENIDEYDMKIDFDLPITFYKEPKYFINKRFAFFSEGESLFPKWSDAKKTAIFDDFVMHEGLIDKVEHFEDIAADRVYVFKKEAIEHSNIVKLNLAQSVIEGIIKEHTLQDGVIGVYFGEEVKFFYHKKKTKEIFRFQKFKFEPVKKVAINFAKKYPKRYEEFLDEPNFLLKAAKLLGMEGDFEKFNRFSMEFGGKGGVSIDCKIDKNGFDFNSFYSSIMSFVLADADNKLIAYSIFESLGDFLSNQAVELLRELKASHIALGGKYIANSAFFSRFIRNTRDVKLSSEYPSDGVGAFGGI